MTTCFFARCRKTHCCLAADFRAHRCQQLKPQQRCPPTSTKPLLLPTIQQTRLQPVTNYEHFWAKPESDGHYNTPAPSVGDLRVVWSRAEQLPVGVLPGKSTGRTERVR